jgi:chromosome segregation ATPase
MPILNSMNDASKSVAILNSDDYSHRYAGATKAEFTKDDSMTIETLLRSIDGRLQTMDGRLDAMDKRLENVDKRLDKVGEDIVELKVQTAAIGARLVGVEQRLDHVDDRFDRIEDRFDRSEERFTRTEDRFDRQEKQQREADGQLIRIEEKLEGLPSWKSFGTASATILLGFCGLFVWLAEGGEKTLAHLFD